MKWHPAAFKKLYSVKWHVWYTVITVTDLFNTGSIRVVDSVIYKLVIYWIHVRKLKVKV